MFFRHSSFAFNFNESLSFHAETLRKYPLSATVNRIAKNDYPIPGSDHVIEKGMWIKIPLLGIHHDPEYYPDPENFDPDRFSNENIKNRHPMTWLPFGNITFFLYLCINSIICFYHINVKVKDLEIVLEIVLH